MVTGRPSLAVGTMGVIRVYRVANGYWARVLVRDPDGRTRTMGRRAASRAAAVTWAAVDLDAGTVEVRGTVIRLTGKGLVLMPTTKSTAGMRTLALPSWCVRMLRDRAERRGLGSIGDDPVFPAPKGGLRDPSNTQADLKDSFEWCGLPWVTSHVFRKTTATLLDGAGLSARSIADQLGHCLLYTSDAADE